MAFDEVGSRVNQLRKCDMFRDCHTEWLVLKKILFNCIAKRYKNDIKKERTEIHCILDKWLLTRLVRG